MGRGFKVVTGLIILILVLLTAYGFIYKAVNKEEAPEFVFTYAENQSDTYPTSQGAYYFSDLVFEKTGGRIKILVYTGARLGREGDIITQMRYGGVDFARVSLSQLAEVDPELNVLQMPYLYNDADHMWKVLEGPIGDSFLAGMASYDMVGLSWYDAGSRSFYVTDKPINTIEDMAGLRIRVQQSELMEDMVKCLGATPVPLSYEEVYSAFELNTIDGAENNWPSYEDTGHYKVAPYYIEDEHTRVPEMQLCSSNTWGLLSREDQQIILECARESALYERELWSEREAVSKEKAILSGVKVITVSSEEKDGFRRAMAPVYSKYCSDSLDLLNDIIDMGNE